MGQDDLNAGNSDRRENKLQVEDLHVGMTLYDDFRKETVVMELKHFRELMVSEESFFKRYWNDYTVIDKRKKSVLASTYPESIAGKNYKDIFFESRDPLFGVTKEAWEAAKPKNTGNSFANTPMIFGTPEKKTVIEQLAENQKKINHLYGEIYLTLNNLKKMQNNPTLNENDKEFHAYKMPDNLDARNMSQEEFATKKTEQYNAPITEKNPEEVNADPENRNTRTTSLDSNGKITYTTDADKSYIEALFRTGVTGDYAKGLILEFLKELPSEKFDEFIDFKVENIENRTHFSISLKS